MNLDLSPRLALHRMFSELKVTNLLSPPLLPLPDLYRLILTGFELLYLKRPSSYDDRAFCSNGVLALPDSSWHFGCFAHVESIVNVCPLAEAGSLLQPWSRVAPKIESTAEAGVSRYLRLLIALLLRTGQPCLLHLTPVRPIDSKVSAHIREAALQPKRQYCPALRIRELTLSKK